MRFRESALAHEICVGSGIEIGGSAHNPFGLDTRNVDVTASLDTPFKRAEVEQCGQALPVDIVASGDDLPLPDESVDFVVSSHVLEHFADPIAALVEWDRVVRPGGVIFAIVPHKERTFDRDRERTSLTHVVDDYIRRAKPADEPHGHEHVWVTSDVVEIIEWMKEHLEMRWHIEVVQDTDDKVGNGFTVAVRKCTT